MREWKFSGRFILPLILIMLLSVALGACGESSPSLALPTEASSTALATSSASSSPVSTGGSPTVNRELATPSVVNGKDVLYVFGPAISESQRDLIQKAIALARSSFGESGPLKVDAKGDVAILRRSEDVLGSATPGEIVLHVASRDWQAVPDAERSVTVLHEYYHTTQFHMAGIEAASYTLGNDYENFAPHWLVEGSADYMSYRLAADNGLVPFERVRRSKVGNVRFAAYPLKSIEQYSPYSPMDYYSIGFLATEFLVTNYGGKTALSRYWQALGQKVPWEVAFQKSFGVLVEDFYLAFETKRAKDFPPDVPVGTIPLPTYDGWLAINLVKALKPGAIKSADPTMIPFIFNITGVRLLTISDETLDNSLDLPSEVSNWSYLGGNAIVIYLKPTAPKGKYSFSLKLPDGRTTKATFEYK